MHALQRLRALVSSPAPAIRTVEVVPPSKRGEGIAVLLVGGFILLCVVYTVAFERLGGPTARAAASSKGGLANYQVLFRDLPGGEQRVFRELQEGWLEILRLHGTSGAWPAIEALARADVPPFAPDVLDRSDMRWSFRQDGLVSQYVGVPQAAASLPSFMLSIQEPDPETGEKAAPGTVDEEHQLLPDGRLLHVTYWKRATAKPSSDVALDPAMRGWSQIRIRTPLEEIMQK